MLVSGHLSPRRNVIAERYAFNSRYLLLNESATDFVAELRRLSKHWSFAAQLDMLRDRIQNKISNGSYWRRVRHSRGILLSLQRGVWRQQQQVPP